MRMCWSVCKIKEFPNKMDAQGKAKETWNRRVKIEIVKGGGVDAKTDS